MSVKKTIFEPNQFVLHILNSVFWSDWLSQVLNICCREQVWWGAGLLAWLYWRTTFRCFAHQNMGSKLCLHCWVKKKNHFKTQLFVLHILIRVFWSDWSNQKFDIDCVGQVWWVVDLSPWLYCKMRLRSFARPTSSLELQHHNITIRTSNFVVDVIKRLAMTRRIFRATWKQFDGSSCRHMSWKASLNFGYYSKASHH